MFPPRCIHPPWRNIEVRSVDQNGSGIGGGRSCVVEYSRGTTPQAWMNDCSARLGRLGKLDEEGQHVQRDQGERHDGRWSALNAFVADWEHHYLRDGLFQQARCRPRAADDEGLERLEPSRSVHAGNPSSHAPGSIRSWPRSKSR